MSAERIYNTTKISELPSTTPQSFLAEGEKRAGVEDVWQTAHLMDVLLKVADPSVLSNGEAGRLLRREQTISSPLVDTQTYENRLETAGEVLDGAIYRSEVARDASKIRWTYARNKAELARINDAAISMQKHMTEEKLELQENRFRKLGRSVLNAVSPSNIKNSIVEWVKSLFEPVVITNLFSNYRQALHEE
jgi:hypothetical protein